MLNRTNVSPMGGACLQTATEVETPQVIRLLGELETGLSNLDKAITTLASRLEPVSRQSVPIPCDNKVQPDEPLVPVADKLRNLRRQVSRMFNEVEDQTSRVEV